MNANDKILSYINENSKIKRYKELEVIINNNTELSQKMDELKNMQKQIVHAEKLVKSNSLIELNKEYEMLLSNLESYPLMNEYLDLQVEINESLQSFKDIVEKGIDSDYTAK